ncbi:MAG: polysaccharide deacetylase family protein [Candidatus Omnitrophica bacterium]|jgi:peptidoglycan/xylan/chitin deacetylase (PgdA/CDA1 family)|nr:polysaccharide deacetylase family protein [Candidatus Omnitrophota bacterium]
MRKALILFLVLLVVLLSLGIFFKDKYVLPILMYHMVYPQAEARYRPAVRDVTFARQMKFLKTFRYNVIPLEKAMQLIREKKKIPPRTVVLTFDDGYRDNLIYALPILKKYNFPATIFIIVDEVEKNPQKLTWADIKVMQNSGLISFGSHCLGAEPLVNIRSVDEIKRQIFESKKILEEKLGREVKLFSYPEGMFNDKIRQLVIDAGYSGAVTTNPGKHYSSDDVFALKRLRISENAANLFIFAVESSGYYTFMKENKRKKHGKK